MIYYSSRDPVFIKKVHLRTWLLRDEIESALKQRLQHGPREDINLEEFKKEYLQDKEQNESSIEGKGRFKILQGGKSEDKCPILEFTKQQNLIPTDKIHLGIFIISEIEMDRMYFFSSAYFVEGQSIVIEFLIPQKFTLNAEVLYVHHYSREGRILSSNKLSYRIGVAFTFLKKGERALLKNFLQSIAYKKKKETPSSSVPEEA